MTDNTRLRIAMQKSGRLSDDSRELLARCGIKINLHTQRLIAMAENMPIDILRVHDVKETRKIMNFYQELQEAK